MRVEDTTEHLPIAQGDVPVCGSCGEGWPCATVRARRVEPPCHWTHPHDAHDWLPIVQDPGAERVLHVGMASVRCPGLAAEPAVIDAAHLARQRAWSERTFGPGTRLLGVLDHIRKELDEIKASPGDVEEWVDVLILAFDGAWRAGWEPQEILDAIKAKQAKNEAREWPDWRTASPDQAIEHVRACGHHAWSADGRCVTCRQEARRDVLALPLDRADGRLTHG